MTEKELKDVCRAVEDFRTGPQGVGFDIGDPAHFERLIVHVKASVRNVSPGDDLELRVGTALCLLGPGGLPPLALHKDLLRQVRKAFTTPGEQQERLMEIVLCYGALPEWRRVPVPNAWAKAWPDAVRMLGRAVEPSLYEANRWLAHLPGFPPDRHLLLGNPLWSEANSLALALINPERSIWIEPGESWVLSCEDDVGAATTRILQTGSTYTEVRLGAKLMWRVDQAAVLQTSSQEEIHLPPGSVCTLSARWTDAFLRVRRPKREDWPYTIPRTGDETAWPRIEGPTTLAIYTCCCGTTSCVEQHRLASWTPTLVSKSKPITVEISEAESVAANAGILVSESKPITVWSFIASAVKGPGKADYGASIVTGAFQQGLYFSLLSGEGVID
ncbi:MAG: hypothetical protein HYZ50_15210 [Deltaproteobacteria bacterium]|nr:hypothetical protein [Deltaproteobacteria bacterium]